MDETFMTTRSLSAPLNHAGMKDYFIQKQNGKKQTRRDNAQKRYKWFMEERIGFYLWFQSEHNKYVFGKRYFKAGQES